MNTYKAPHSTKNMLKKAINLEYSKQTRNRDKKDFATKQDVFDKKTLKTLSKFYFNEKISKLSTELISSGKEANVYHSTNIEKTKEFAVKIYKTMVMAFKDREEYISGEFRFRRRGKNSRTNPHKLIKVWAEKEFRNLKRLEKNNIRCPSVFFLKENILVMEFMGKNGQATPRLRDVKLPQERHSELYIQVLKLMRKMFIKCKLVHGDLSEFNMLYDGELIVIDVSQSMEDNHPVAIEFLKRDIYNINYYFGSQGVLVFRLRDIFKFVTDKGCSEEVWVEKMIEGAVDRKDDLYRQDIEVFMGINIPRSLFQIDFMTLEKIMIMKIKQDQMERDMEEDPIYSNMVGLPTDYMREVVEEKGEGEEEEEGEVVEEEEERKVKLSKS